MRNLILGCLAAIVLAAGVSKVSADEHRHNNRMDLYEAQARRYVADRTRHVQPRTRYVESRVVYIDNGPRCAPPVPCEEVPVTVVHSTTYYSPAVVTVATDDYVEAPCVVAQPVVVAPSAYVGYSDCDSFVRVSYSSYPRYCHPRPYPVYRPHPMYRPYPYHCGPDYHGHDWDHHHHYDRPCGHGTNWGFSIYFEF